MLVSNLPTTIAQAAAGLRSGAYSSVELTQSFLDRINLIDSKVHSLLTVTKEIALAQAEAADLRISSGDNNRLLGIPLVHKDNFLTKQVRTTAGSKILDQYVGQYDADVVSRLCQAGAVMLGKSNLDAFAHGSSTENSDYGPSFNPWNLNYVPGGSSGGSAAAVAAQNALLATGSDTGGSVRLPASFTNTVGLKPTYGRVSRYGVIAMGSSFDSIGHFTRTVEDSAIVAEVTAGHSRRDATTPDIPVPGYVSSLPNLPKGLKVGLPEEFFSGAVDGSVMEVIEQAKQKMADLGMELVPVSLPHSSYALAAYYILVPSEISSNLSRFDGLRFGHSVEADVLSELYERSRATGFGSEAKRRIMLGTYALSAGYYDAYYKKAQQVRTLVKNDFDQVFNEVDLLLSPVSASLPFKVGERTDDPLQMYLTDILTVPVNLAGNPSLALPAGFADDLPVGMQLIGRQFDEQLLFQAGHAYQQVTDWHMRLAEVET